jgi:hypothetical protein
VQPGRGGGSGNGHAAFFAGQAISGHPPEFAGVIDISAHSPFAALTVRSLTNSRGDFLFDSAAGFDRETVLRDAG